MNAEEIRKMGALTEIIKSHGDFAYGINKPEDIAIEWDDWDFTPEQVDAWLSARCFTPEAAHDLAEYNITPAQAGKMTELGGYRDTVGYQYANDNITLDEAIEEVEKV